MTFRVIKLKNMFVKALKASACQRWKLQSKKNTGYDLRSFKDTVITASKIPEPINVKWENITYTGKNKFFRRLFSTLITLLLFAICKAHKLLSNAKSSP